MKKLDYKMAAARFEEQGRTDIRLLEEGYVSWKRDANFLDLICGEVFRSTPRNVYHQRSCHPKRAMEQRRQTCIEKYGKGKEKTQAGIERDEKKKQTSLERHGETHPFKSPEIQKKRKEAFLKRYGVENPSQAASVKAKVRETNRRNLGVDYPSQSKEVRERQKKACLEKYGVEYVSQTVEFKQKVKDTCLDKFGVVCPFQKEGVSEKIKKTNRERYGYDFYLQANAIRLDTGKSLVEFWNGIQDPKPSYHWLFQRAKNQIRTNENLTESFLEQIFVAYNEDKTDIELLGEKLFGVSRYNCKAHPDLLYKPDFKLSEKIFVNVDGLYWHSEARKPDKNSHVRLREEMEKTGLTILQFREDEIKSKPDLVSSMVKNKLGMAPSKIFARKTKVFEATQKEVDSFLEENHLMGKTKAKHLVLKNNQGNFVAIMSYKVFSGGICHIERFCSLRDTVVVGGFSKLLNALENFVPNMKEIHYWVDLRYGSGTHLEQQGFSKVRETLGWKWTDGVSTFNRLKCRANMDERKLSEREHAEELGWVRIYDAGQRLFVKTME